MQTVTLACNLGYMSSTGTRRPAQRMYPHPFLSGVQVDSKRYAQLLRRIAR